VAGGPAKGRSERVQFGHFISNDVDDIDQAAGWGYDYLEIMPSLLGPLDLDEPPGQAAMLDRLRSSALPVGAMCGFVPAPLVVAGPDVDRDRLRAHVARVFGRMRRVGVDVIAYGSPQSRLTPLDFPAERALQQVRDFLRLCADLGEAAGITVCVEPQARYLTPTVHTVLDGLALVEAVDRPNIRLMADFAHMLVNAEAFDVLQRAGPRLVHAHVGDPEPGHGATTPAQHAAFVTALRAAGYDGRVTVSHPLRAYASPAGTAAALKRLATAGERPAGGSR
jgi:sugar phosphate isomerase/epimerase